MRRMHHMSGIGLVCILLLLLVACEPSSTCHQDTAVRMEVTLIADSLDEMWNTVIYTEWDSLSVQGVGSDSMIVDNKRKVSSFAAELKSQDTVTAYKMTYHGSIDTLYIHHTPRQQFPDPACGCVIYHTIRRAYSTDSRVDSVLIVNAAVELVQQVNICICLSE